MAVVSVATVPAMMHEQVHQWTAQKEQIRNIGQKPERMLPVVFEHIEQGRRHHRADEHGRKADRLAMHGALRDHFAG